MKLNKKIVTGIGGGILAVVVIVAITAAGAKKKEAEKHVTAKKMAQKNAPRPVRFEKIKSEPLAKQRSFPGIVKASEETALSFRVGGPLTEVNIILGETVKKGDLLMQIDPRDFEDRIRSLEAQLAGATALQQNAKADYKRVAGLFEEKVVSQSDYDRAKSSFDSSDASVKNLNAQLQVARHALLDTSLFAPYDGTVTKQMVENYEMIKAGAVVMTYHNIKTLEIVVNMPENEVASSPVNTGGMAVDVSFPALPGKTFKARLKEWSTQSNPLTRTYATTFQLDVPDGVRILPGMTANVERSNEDGQARVLTVPVSSLVADTNGGTSVWVYDEEGGDAVLRQITVGVLKGASRVVVTAGLSEGELVVITGSRLIHDKLSLKTAFVR